MSDAVPDRLEDLPRGEYAFPGPLRDRLVTAILAGDKTSTTSLAEGYRAEGTPLPRVGDLEAVVDSDETQERCQPSPTRRRRWVDARAASRPRIVDQRQGSGGAHRPPCPRAA